MNLADSIRVAVEALVANKLRALLTMLGIVIGVGAVIALMAVGQGTQKAVEDKIAGLGSNLLFIEPGSSSSSGGLQGGLGTAQTLSLDDASAIPENVPGVVASVAEVQVPSQVSGSGTNTFTRVTGVSSDYANVLKFDMSGGEFFSSVDVDSNKRVAVLGGSIAAQLFPDADPVGQTIRIGISRTSFLTLDVVGVLKTVGGNSGNSQDTQVYVPITLAQRQISAVRGARNASVEFDQERLAVRSRPGDSA